MAAHKHLLDRSEAREKVLRGATAIADMPKPEAPALDAA
jgi:hypothetical protein